MGKRKRERPCPICWHYHKYEEGEVCGDCGHRMVSVSDDSAASAVHLSASPSEILREFLYLGSYHNAARDKLLKTLGISRVLNTAPACRNLHEKSFTHHCLQGDKNLPFDDAIQFLEQCEKDRAHVLVHCMSGKNRSPAIVMAYLMKSKGWKLAYSYQWVKERRPSVELNQAVRQQLQEYEQKIFSSNENGSTSFLSFGFSRPKNPALPVPTFNNTGRT